MPPTLMVCRPKPLAKRLPAPLRAVLISRAEAERRALPPLVPTPKPIAAKKRPRKRGGAPQPSGCRKQACLRPAKKEEVGEDDAAAPPSAAADMAAKASPSAAPPGVSSAAARSAAAPSDAAASTEPMEPPLTGSERRRLARIRAAELLGPEGIMAAFVEGDYQAALHISRQMARARALR
jgi:hypothetical protein